MRDECVRVQEKVIALGAKGASSSMEIRRHAKTCPLCKEFMQSLSQLEQTEHDLEQYDPPQDMVGGTLARVLQEARERSHAGDPLNSPRTSRGLFKALRSLWQSLFTASH